MKTTQHTPLPWHIADSSEIWSGDQPVLSIAHEENSNLSAEEASANQRFIVTACNAHNLLVEACKVAKQAIDLQLELDDKERERLETDAVALINTALAKAQGKE